MKVAPGDITSEKEGMTLVYRMLALDIDGTLLQSNNKLNRHTKDAIAFAQKKDVYVTLVTERHFHAANKVAKALKLDNTLVTQNGAFVASSIDQPLYENRIRREHVKPLIETLETYHCHIRVSHERFSVGNRVKQKSDLVAKMTIGVGDPLFYPVTYVEELGDYLMENDIAPTKIEVQFFDEDGIRDALDEVERHFPDVDMQHVKNNEYDIVAAGVSKEKGLQYVADSLGLSSYDIVAVGDSYNDKAMIERAGLGVAMKNAPQDVKQAADWITRSNDQNGVSYMVREVFRKQLRIQI